MSGAGVDVVPNLPKCPHGTDITVVPILLKYLFPTEHTEVLLPVAPVVCTGGICTERTR